MYARVPQHNCSSNMVNERHCMCSPVRYPIHPKSCLLRYFYAIHLMSGVPTVSRRFFTDCEACFFIKRPRCPCPGGAEGRTDNPSALSLESSDMAWNGNDRQTSVDPSVHPPTATRVSRQKQPNLHVSHVLNIRSNLFLGESRTSICPYVRAGSLLSECSYKHGRK